MKGVKDIMGFATNLTNILDEYKLFVMIGFIIVVIIMVLFLVEHLYNLLKKILQHNLFLF